MGIDRRGFGRMAAAVAFALGVAGGAQAQEVVKIGYTGPLSGGAALYGKNALSGIEMAVQELNAAGFEVGGKKYKLEVVALDDKYAPSEAAINARRLVQQHKAPVVFVPHSGGIFALQAFNEREKFIVGAYSSVPAIVERGNKLTLMIPPAFTGYIEPFINYETKRFGKNVAIANADHDYAKAWTKAFVPALEKAGGKVVADNPMSYNKSTDFYSGVSRVLTGNPDVLFIGGASEPTALVVKQARELGFKGGFMLMDQAKMDEMARVLGGYELLEGSIGTMPLVADSRDSATAFVERYRKVHGADKDPTSEVSLNYTATHLVAQAMKLAGTVSDPEAIRAKADEAAQSLDAAHNPNEIDGVAENGAFKANVVVGIVEDGKVQQVRLSEIAQN
jgi:branched-chain amino acid transport system substrate-binding protein